MMGLFTKFKKARTKASIKKDNLSPVTIITPLDNVIKEYVKRTKKDGVTNVVVLRYVKKDSNVLYKVETIQGSSVKANGAYYIIDARAIQFIRVDFRNNETADIATIKVPIVDVYEGRTEAVSHERWASDISLSEEFQKQVYLELQNGILTAKRKQAANLRQILVYGFIAIVAIVIIGGVFFNK